MNKRLSTKQDRSRKIAARRAGMIPNRFRLTMIAFGCTAAMNALAQMASQTDSTRFEMPLPSLPSTGPAPAAVRPSGALVDRIRMEVDRDSQPADGQSPIKVTVRLLDASGRPVTATTTVSIENSGGRIQLKSRATDEAGPARGDLDRVTPGVQVRVENGSTEFYLLAPSDPQDVMLKVSADGVSVEGRVSFVPEMREMLVTGFIEGVVARRKDGDNGGRTDDGLVKELERFHRVSNDGKTDYGAHSEFFLKGVVKGEYLLTMAYDSDKATASRLFRDIRPEEFYPVYGDSSIKGFDARTTQSMYIRVDKERSFLLYGDFTTSSAFPGQSLGQYRRSLTGLNTHYESARAAVNVFAARDNTKQVIEEQPARGVSGPYNVTNLSGIRNSEKVEIVTRDRNQPSVILSTQEMARFVDYTFEPFSGQVVFKSPVPTYDANLNPNTVRITYEVDQGGPKYTIAGFDGQFKITENLAVGGSAATSEDPLDKYRLVSLNSTFKLGERTALIGEVAESHRDQSAAGTGLLPTKGRAGRLEFRHAADAFQVRALLGSSGIDFDNSASSLQKGRIEAAASASYQFSPKLKVAGDLMKTEDKLTGAERHGGQVFTEYKVTDSIAVEIGLRKSRDKLGTGNTSVSANAAGVSNVATSGAASTPYLINSPTSAQAPQLTDANSLRLKVTGKINEKSSVFGELERDVKESEKNRIAFGGDYQLAEQTRLYGRAERATSSSGPYGLNTTARDTAVIVGIDTSYMKDGQVFSEYRLRDAIEGKDAQAALGLRNQWKLAEGIGATTGFERVKSLSGTGVSATALTGGIELTYDPNWKSSGRLELRQDNNTNTILSTIGYTLKLDRDWSVIARNYLNVSNARTAAANESKQDKLQVGFAYRPADNNTLAALGRYELKIDRQFTQPDSLTRSTTQVVSTQVVYHPTRPWWWSGRVAAKTVDESLEGVASKYNAFLVGGRVVYDITKRWDIGFATNVMYSPDGSARQYAAGLEVGYLVAQNLWVSGGYNWWGFSDRDLTGSDYTNRGPYLRLRYKFDEDLLPQSWGSTSEKK